jgi:hypothetical protein
MDYTTSIVRTHLIVSYILVKFKNYSMRLSLATVAVFILTILPVLASAQNNQAFDVNKAKGSEGFTFPFGATNHDLKNPLVYTYEEPKTPSWILTIRNNLTYTTSDGVKTVIKIQEPAPSQKFIEITMFGDQSKKYLVSVNTPDTGYTRLYNGDLGGWSTEAPITIGHDINQGISVTDGKRIVVDRLDLQGFSVGSIAVYGNDDANSTFRNANGGDISFGILYGSVSDSPLYFMPAAVMAGVGGLVIALLVFKKRKHDD